MDMCSRHTTYDGMRLVAKEWLCVFCVCSLRSARRSSVGMHRRSATPFQPVTYSSFSLVGGVDETEGMSLRAALDFEATASCWARAAARAALLRAKTVNAVA